MMKKLRIGFVGAGSIMRVHAETIRTRNDAEVVAVADVSEPSLDVSCAKFGITQRFNDYNEMLNKCDLDVVFVCSPPIIHAEATMTSLRAGCHVLCEKPPAMNATEAAAMASLAEQSELRLFYGLQRRFQANAQATRKYLEQGRFGEVYHASSHWFRRRGIPGLGSWFTNKSVAGAGALYDIGVHMFDLTHYLMGQPTPVSVSAASHSRFVSHPETYTYTGMWGTRVTGGTCDVEDIGMFLVRFANGATLVCQASWAANTKESIELRIMGDKGGAMLDGGKELTILGEDNGFIADIHPMLKNDAARADMLTHFFDAIHNPEKPLITGGRDGVVLQAMLDAVIESAEKKREVDVRIPEIAAD